MTGLNHFITTGNGINGKIKQRYSDFLVEEVLSHRVCKAKNLEGEMQENIMPAIPENSENFDFLHLDLEKTNRDLHDAVRQIARFLHISPSRIGYAGIKDKRAVTCQRISIYRPDLNLLKEFKSKTIRLAEPEWSDKKIDLGMLKGNRFTVIIRKIELGESEIKKRVKKTMKEAEKGIPNYFGAQRFGGIREVSHLVGKEIIKENFEKAAMLYLSKQCEEEQVKEAREFAARKEFKKALNEFPKKYRYERIILHHLISTENDFIGALRKIPKKILFLFTHAYQAFLFNEILSQRIEKGIGLEKVEGEPCEKSVPLGLLPGSDSKFSAGEIGLIERSVLKKEGITFADFNVKKMPECSSRGSRKAIAMKAEDLKLVEVSEDEFNAGKKKCIVSFSLEKGCYATVLLGEIMKEKNVC